MIPAKLIQALGSQKSRLYVLYQNAYYNFFFFKLKSRRDWEWNLNSNEMLKNCNTEKGGVMTGVLIFPADGAPAVQVNSRDKHQRLSGSQEGWCTHLPRIWPLSGPTPQTTPLFGVADDFT